jgi:hypothetical protein
VGIYLLLNTQKCTIFWHDIPIWWLVTTCIHIITLPYGLVASYSRSLTACQTELLFLNHRLFIKVYRAWPNR